MGRKIKQGDNAYFRLLCGEKGFAIFFNCLFIGVAGWVMETLVCSLFYGGLRDRGFLVLPFCPIYAVGLALYYLVGKRPKGGFVSFLKVALLIGVVGTLLEGATGLLLEKIGITLWYYDEGVLPLSLRYISLPVSLFWALGGAAYLLWVVPLITRWGEGISQRARRVLTTLVPILFLCDLVLSCVRVAQQGGYTTLY